jgi:hypothetical protein
VSCVPCVSGVSICDCAYGFLEPLFKQKCHCN